jgi:hypothetical protein
VVWRPGAVVGAAVGAGVGIEAVAVGPGDVCAPPNVGDGSVCVAAGVDTPAVGEGRANVGLGEGTVVGAVKRPSPSVRRDTSISDTTTIPTAISAKSQGRSRRTRVLPARRTTSL